MTTYAFTSNAQASGPRSTRVSDGQANERANERAGGRTVGQTHTGELTDHATKRAAGRPANQPTNQPANRRCKGEVNSKRSNEHGFHHLSVVNGLTRRRKRCLTAFLLDDVDDCDDDDDGDVYDDAGGG